MTKSKCSKEICCCGHSRDEHVAGFSMCLVCKQGCDRFHKPGEGHSLLSQIVLAAIAAVLVLIAVAMMLIGLRAVWVAMTAAGMLDFIPWRNP